MDTATEPRSARLAPTGRDWGIAAALALATGVLYALTFQTRWFGDGLCAACVELSLSRAEPNPRDVRKQGNRAVWSFTLALLGWIIVLVAAAVLMTRRPDSPLNWTIVLSLFSLVPALFAVGQGCPVLLTRGPYFRFAASGIVLGGLHLGLLLGVLLINLWHN